VKLRYPLLLGAAVALGAAAPAAGATVTVRGLDTLTWDNPSPVIKAGDTVVWTFAGTTQPHNVASNTSNWNFSSTVGAPAPDTSRPFDAPGVYGFVCQVHSAMTGTVTVTDAAGTPPPPPPPPPLSEQPLTNDVAAVAPDAGIGPVETGGLDRTRPRLRHVRVQRRPHGARVSFRLSERSMVTVRLERGGKVVKTRHVRGSGRIRLTVRDKSLRPGRYSVQLRAEDVAGNRSGVRTARITVR
jgi:plastocyanin